MSWEVHLWPRRRPAQWPRPHGITPPSSWTWQPDSGRTGTATPPGLYRLWAKVREGKMSNPDVEDGDPAWYYIEDVPWTLNFHEGYSLHAAFWHDAFGFTRSHGCVNVPTAASQWIYRWCRPDVPYGEQRVFAKADNATVIEVVY